MKSDQFFPAPQRRFLRKSDVEERELVLTVKDVRGEKIGKDEREKPVMYFDEIDQALVLNWTNWNICSKLYGEDSDSWAGQRIRLVAVSGVSFEGKAWKGIGVGSAETATSDLAEDY